MAGATSQRRDTQENSAFLVLLDLTPIETTVEVHMMRICK